MSDRSKTRQGQRHDPTRPATLFHQWYACKLTKLSTCIAKYMTTINKIYFFYILHLLSNAPFSNMGTLKFKAQPTNAFFATVNQMFGCSSQAPITTEHCFVVWTALGDLITARSAVSRKLGGVVQNLIDGSKKRFCRLNFEFWSPYVIERRRNDKFTMIWWEQW